MVRREGLDGDIMSLKKIHWQEEILKVSNILYICKIKNNVYTFSYKTKIGSYEKDLRAKIFRRKFFEKLFYKLSEIHKR